MKTNLIKLSTSRLFLRPLTIGDIELLWPHVSNPLIPKFMSWQAHQNIEETRAFLKGVEQNWKSGRCMTWGIFLDRDFCGIFSLINILATHRSLTYNRAELAYWCSLNFQRKGIMTEAGQRVMDFAFHDLNLHKLVVGHDVRNEASENLIQKLCFRFAYEEKQAFKKDGHWCDVKFYELLQEEYLLLEKL